MLLVADSLLLFDAASTLETTDSTDSPIALEMPISGLEIAFVVVSSRIEDEIAVEVAVLVDGSELIKVSICSCCVTVSMVLYEELTCEANEESKARRASD